MPKFQPIASDASATFKIAQRITEAHPAYEKAVLQTITQVHGLRGSNNEILNALLILERVIEDESLDMHDETYQTLLASAAVGLRLDQLRRNEPVSVISSEEQLAEDISIAVFTTLYGSNPDEEDRKVTPLRSLLTHYAPVEREYVTSFVVTLSNPYLEPLLRARPEDHQRIGKYVTERVFDSKSAEAVVALARYLDDTDKAQAIENGWL